MPPWRMSAPVAAKKRSACPMRASGGRAGGATGGLELRGQSVALLGVEHGVALEERDLALGLVALVVGLGAGDAVGIDDELAGFALTDVAAKLERLPEGQPERAGIPFLDGGRPQHDDVDALVGDAVVPEGACDPADGVFAAPWLHPGAHTLLEVGKDAGSDAAVNVLLVVGHGPVFRGCEVRDANLCPSARPGCASGKRLRGDPAARSRRRRKLGGSCLQARRGAGPLSRATARTGRICGRPAIPAQGIVTRMGRDRQGLVAEGHRARSTGCALKAGNTGAAVRDIWTMGNTWVTIRRD